jgi:putative heme-binding domain-containing protein
MALGDDARLALWLDKVVPRLPSGAVPNLATLQIVGEWITAMESRRRSWAAFAKTNDPDLAPIVSRLERLLASARSIVADGQTDPRLRLAALTLLGHEPDRRMDDLALLAPLLEPRTSQELHAATLQTLAAWNDSEATEVLLERWPQFSPEARAAVTGSLLTRAENVSRLLEAIREGEITAVDIGPSHRQQLLKHPDKALAAKAELVFQSSSNAGRREVLDALRPALSLAGRPDRGEPLFKERCSLCHVLQETGTAIGPDLRSVTDRSTENLLVAMVDPSRNVEPKYLAYTATLASGESVHGLILSETGNSLIMQQLDGTRRELLRADIESLVGSRLSFMPEGLEAGMTPRDVADLIAFVQEATEPGQ